MLKGRLKAFRHWESLQHQHKYPRWAHLQYPDVDFQDIIYYSAPNKKPKYNSLDEVEPELLETFRKLGISLEEQKRLTGVAVDVVMDSVSVATTFKEQLGELGIIFCSFGEAVQKPSGSHPKIHGLGGALHGQFLCGLELGPVLLRRIVLLHPQGRPMPDGTIDLFSASTRPAPDSSSVRSSWPKKAAT